MTPDNRLNLFERLGGRTAIMVLLRNFYATVRIDPELGPIFNRAILDWPSHLENIADFWSTQTGGPPAYRGGMGKHFSLGLKPNHFEAWLRQWEKSCRLHFPDSEAGELIAIAQGFGARMLASLKQKAAFRLLP